MVCMKFGDRYLDSGQLSLLKELYPNRRQPQNGKNDNFIVGSFIFKTPSLLSEESKVIIKLFY